MLCRSAVGGIILAVTYALPVKDKDDPFIQDAEAAMGILARTSSPGTNAVDTFPFCRSARRKNSYLLTRYKYNMRHLGSLEHGSRNTSQSGSNKSETHLNDPSPS